MIVTPLTDTITKPRGFGDPRVGSAMERARSGSTVHFAKRVQAIREELWALHVALDDIDGITDGASMMVLHAIDLLGVAARCETMWKELPADQVDAVKRLFEDEARAL